MEISLKRKNIFNVRNKLGEGLFVSKDIKAWVDINNNRLFYITDKDLIKYETSFKTSVVFGLDKNYLLLGTDLGVIEFDILNYDTEIKNSFESIHNVDAFRSNDGIKIDDCFFLGFMHRKNPTKEKGFLYRIFKNEISLIDDSIYIPNTFIPLSRNELLVSDSFKSEIWAYKFNKNGCLSEKVLWKRLDRSMSPDGGCIVKDKIFIAMWDDSSIHIFDKKGNFIERLELDILKPTNCKFDKNTNSLWITSAREDMTEKQLSIYPNSGSLQQLSIEGFL